MIAYPRGAIIGCVPPINCFKLPIPVPRPQKWMLVFEQPEAFPTPSPYAGQLFYFYITDEVGRQPPPRDDFPFKDQCKEWLCL